jgi:hypothetical protein
MTHEAPTPRLTCAECPLWVISGQVWLHQNTSALHPRTDMLGVSVDVCKMPIANIGHQIGCPHMAGES